MRINPQKTFFIILLGVFFAFSNCQADEQEEKPSALQGIEFFTGFARTDLHFKSDYCFVPLIVDFDFGLKDLADKIGFNPPGLLQFQLEPYLGFVSQPDTNVELGNSFFLKMGILPETFKLQPYIKFGPGLAYMTQHVREQSTQFNFTETGVVGMQYLFNKNNSFAVEFRYRHLSNAGMDRPNHGINTYLIAAGISRQF